MRVYVPFTFRHRPTVEAVSAWDHQLVPLDGAEGTDPWHDYVGYFQDRWRDERSFVNCEHDVVPTTEQLYQLHLCPQVWCCFNEYDGGPPTLSLARFRRQFILAHPRIWSDLRADHGSSGGKQPLWTRCDSWLVERAGVDPHVHERPHVVNVRPAGSLH